MVMHYLLCILFLFFESIFGIVEVGAPEHD